MAIISIQDSSAVRANGFRGFLEEGHRVGILDFIVSRRFRPEAALCVIGILAVGLIAFVSYRTHVNVATAGLLCVIVVVLLSRAGGFASSIVTSILAAVWLAYLAPPAHSFRIDDPLDVAAIATFLITSFLISRLVSKLKKTLDDSRSRVSRRLVDAEEQERARIARELHDDINQQLALLAVNLDCMKQGLSTSAAELRCEIGEASKTVKDLVNDVQALSHRLHSSKLEVLGLAKAAAGFCRELAQRLGLEIEFHAENVPEELPTEISFCLFRVLQEALQNASKYSGSRRFQTSLVGGSNEILLTVRDPGIGFDPEEAMKGSGLGLTSMRERMRLVDGTLSIDSRLERGTRIQARVPLKPRMMSATSGR